MDPVTLAIMAAVGMGVGGGGGILEGMLGQGAVSDYKSDVRRGIKAGEAQAAQQTYNALQSDEMQQMMNWVRGLFGMDAAQTGEASILNPYSFGGETYLAAPTGQRASDRERGQGRNYARQIDRYLEIQKMLETGVGQKGKDLTDAQRAKLERQLGKVDIDALMDSSMGMDAGALNELAHQLAKKGVSIEDFQGLAGEFSGDTEAYQAALAQKEAAAAAPDPAAPLYDDFRKGLAQGQVSRGIYSSHAGAAAEGAGLATMRAQMQAQMLSQLQGLATTGDALYMGFEPQAIQKMIQFATGGMGGPSTPQGLPGLQGALSGMFGGAQLGMMMGAGGGGGARPNLDMYAGYPGVSSPMFGMFGFGG